MLAVVQRVNRASVTVEGEVVGRIERGLVVLAGVAGGDSDADVQYIADKVANLRIFPDAAGRFQHSVQEVGGEVLVVSQFTLLGDARRGRRPDFTAAAPPEVAAPLVERLCSEMAATGLRVQSGRFRAYMLVDLVNDGPVTVLLDSKKSF